MATSYWLKIRLRRKNPFFKNPMKHLHTDGVIILYFSRDLPLSNAEEFLRRKIFCCYREQLEVGEVDHLTLGSVGIRVRLVIMLPWSGAFINSQRGMVDLCPRNASCSQWKKSGRAVQNFFGSLDNLIEWRLRAAHNITHVQSKGLFLIQIQRGLMTHVLDRVVVGENSGWVEREKQSSGLLLLTQRRTSSMIQ